MAAGAVAAVGLACVMWERAHETPEEKKARRKARSRRNAQRMTGLDLPRLKLVFADIIEVLTAASCLMPWAQS